VNSIVQIDSLPNGVESNVLLSVGRITTYDDISEEYTVETIASDSLPSTTVPRLKASDLFIVEEMNEKRLQIELFGRYAHSVEEQLRATEAGSRDQRARQKELSDLRKYIEQNTEANARTMTIIQRDAESGISQRARYAQRRRAARRAEEEDGCSVCGEHAVHAGFCSRCTVGLF
jgi:predicted phage gp36 major capsid-like protein